MIAGAAPDGSTTSVPLRRIIPVVVAVVTDRLSKKSARARIHPPIYAYMAPHATKIYTPITRGSRHRANRLFSRSGSASRVDSIPIVRPTLRQCQATQGYKIGVKTLIRWESRDSTPRWRRSPGLTNPALPRRVQSHAAVHINELRDSHAPSKRERSHVAETRPVPADGQRQLQGSQKGAADSFEQESWQRSTHERS